MFCRGLSGETGQTLNRFLGRPPYARHHAPPGSGGGGGDRVSCGMVMVIHDDRKVFAPCARYGKSG
ncbi:hypothetical protein CFR74_13540 [Novacetimonas hansenii]|nr:hypothetical protein CFR74_13540 [Novacetimonas hansenii]